MKRHTLIIIGLAILAGAGIFLTYRYSKYPRAPVIQTMEFGGSLQSIKGNSIFVEGMPLLADAKAFQSIGIDPNNRPTVEIVVTADTKITRTTFLIPSAEELKKTDGWFRPGELPREQSSVGIDTLQNDFKTAHHTIGIRIVSATNVIGRQKLTAQQIEYTFPSN